MAEIAWHLLNPVDAGAQAQQGFATGMALVKGIQTRNALGSYLANPDDPHAYSALAYLDPAAAADAQRQHLIALKAQQDAQDRERAVALGTLAAQDPMAARQEALQAGDFDLAKEFGGLEEEQQKKTAAFWTQAAPLAYKLKQIQDPQERIALYQQALPVLQATGADPQVLASFDPTNDTALDAAIATGQKVSDLIEQSKITWHQQGEQPSFATDFMGRPVGSANPYAQGGSIPSTAPASSGATVTPQASAVASELASGGLPENVVAGFLGNFHAEGGYGGAAGDGGTAMGIAQWRGERARNFERIIGKPPAAASPQEQAQFVLWEMNNPEAAGMTRSQRDAILHAASPEAAASLIDEYYERSSGEHRGRRVAAATQLASAIAPRSVATKAEFDALPSGTVFIAPDGSRRRKP